MSVQDFHKSRRMFCIHEGKILVSPPKSPLSHREWFTNLGLDAQKTIDESVRGFIDDRGLFFYKGDDFIVDDTVEKTFLRHLIGLQKTLNLPDETQVYGGVKKIKETKYPPAKEYGKIRDILRTKLPVSDKTKKLNY